jgi:hypothetical protein
VYATRRIIIPMRKRTVISVKTRYVKSNKIVEPILDFMIQSQDLDENMTEIHIIPGNEHTHDNLYKVQTDIEIPTYHVSDIFTVLASILFFAYIFYRILFGDMRLRPWGLVQFFVLRRYGFGKLHPLVTSVDREWARRNRELSSIDVVESQRESIHSERASMAETVVPSTLTNTDNHDVMPYWMRFAQKDALSSSAPSMARWNMNTDHRLASYMSTDDSQLFGSEPSQAPRAYLASDYELSKRVQVLEMRQQQLIAFQQRQKAHQRRQAEFERQQRAFQLRIEMFYLSLDLFQNTTSDTTPTQK